MILFIHIRSCYNNSITAGTAVLLSKFIGSDRKLTVSIGLTIEAAALVCLSREYMLVVCIYQIDNWLGNARSWRVAFIFVAAIVPFTKRIDNMSASNRKGLETRKSEFVIDDTITKS